MGGVHIFPLAAQISEVTSKGLKKFDHKYKLTGRLQLRTIWAGSREQRDRVSTAEELEGASQNTNYYDFKPRRIRFGIKGTINDIWLYVIDIRGEDLVTTKVGAGGIQEAAIGYKPNDSLRIRLGSHKIPFTREQINSSANLLTIERSMITTELGNQFDTGVTIDGRILGKNLYYGAGIYNGNGGFSLGTKSGTKSNSPFFSTRFQYDPLGEYKYGKSVFSDDMLLSLALSAYYQALDEDKNKHRWAASTDIVFNFSDLNAQLGYVHSSNKERGTDHSIYGYYIQASYFIWQKVVQPWLRYEGFYDDALKSELNKTQYLSFGSNFYFSKGHKVKLQLGYYLGINEGLGIQDDWAALQMQITF